MSFFVVAWMRRFVGIHGFELLHVLSLGFIGFSLVFFPDRVDFIMILLGGSVVTFFLSCWVKRRSHYKQEVIAGLRKKVDLFRSIVKGAVDPIMVLDQRGCIVVCNAAAEQLFGYSRKELLGKPVVEFIVPFAYRVAHNEALKSLLRSDGCPEVLRRMDLPGLCKDGSQIPLELVLKSICVDGKFYYKALMRDRTERVQLLISLRESLKKAEMAGEAKSEFLTNMSHEFRTPMNAVLGLTELVLESSLTKEQEEYMQIIQRSGNSLLRLIDQVLDFSKLDVCEIRLEKVWFGLPVLVKEICVLLRGEALKKGLEFYCVLDEKLSSVFMGDPLRLRQVLVNLVGNAIKFTEEGSVTLVVKKDDGGGISFSVVDTGIGIPSDKIEVVFDRFQQVDASLSRKYNGMGLGLSISKELVVLMGGVLHVSSEEGKGSTFSFCLPDCERPDGFSIVSRKSTVSLLKKGTGSGKRGLVLVVENDLPNQTVAVQFLEQLGYVAEVASNGQVALDLMRGIQFCFVLMDIRMPVMDGVETIRLIRDGNVLSESKDVFVLVQTASILPSGVEFALRAGANAFLLKPYSVLALREILEANGFSCDPLE